MKPFLYEVAQDIINKQYNLNTTCIVLPNKRTGSFFKKYYGELIQKSSWSPNIFTIDSLFKKFTHINSPDKLTLIIILYDIAKKVFNQSENKEYFANYTFDKFYGIAEIIINDFSDIDNYLIDADYLFRNIKDIQEIDIFYFQLDDNLKELLREFWLSFSIEQRSAEKQKFLILWEKLPEIYNQFTKVLLDKKLAYSGLRNKYLKLLIDKNEINTNQFSTYIFVGFNALNKAEKYIFNFLQKQGKAKFYWDSDTYYIDDKKQEAGFFMRPNLDLFPDELKSRKDNISKNPKKVEIIGVPMQVGQAKSLETILYNLQQQDKEYYNKTAIILADEHLLFPVLHSLPNSIPSINITMGYPLKDTTLYSLLINYIELQEFAINKKQKKTVYYFKDVIKVLKHPDVWQKIPELGSLIINHLEEKNKIYIDYQYFIDYKNKFLELLFSPVFLTESPTISLLTNILNILFYIFEKKEEQNIKTLENEYIYQVYVQIKRLRDIIEKEGINIDFGLNITIKLLQQIFSTVRIPFTGEHSGGLQIMGLMETRNLDFENIIILSVNEGVLPDTGRKPTFISDSLRIAFDLPILKFQDSIFAYFFYRLFQKSRNVTILYNSIIGNNNGEISRFVQQLKFESGFDINEKQFKQELKPHLKKNISIEKDDKILSSLKSYLQDSNQTKKQFSASAINNYIDCSLKFYFKYVASLKQKMEIEEEITPMTFGTILHSTIEKLYNDVANQKNSKTIESSDFEYLYQNIEKFTEQAFKDYYKTEEDLNFNFEGTNIIVKDVVMIHIKNILKIDKLHAPFQIIDLEQEYGYNMNIEIEVENTKQNAVIWGVFDRIDIKNNINRIIDYKTGSVEKSFSSVEELFNSANVNRQTAIFQMFYYSLIYSRKLINFDNNLIPAIYNIREMIKDDFKPDIIFKKDKKTKFAIDNYQLPLILNEFEQHLKLKISEIFDTNIAFSQTQNENICEYCDYKLICNK